MNAWLFAVAGAFAGVAQAGLLLRSVRGAATPLSFLFRLLLVAGVLLFAARAGSLLPAAAGWFTGFCASVALLRSSLS
tara:strand:- start:269 stop:502 length:234 start_codon:yes stop_codon:yes gene_type:complete